MVKGGTVRSGRVLGSIRRIGRVTGSWEKLVG